MIASLLTAARLCGALVSLYGAETGDARACRAGVIAAAVAHEWPPELIAAIAYGESRFDPHVVNPRTHAPAELWPIAADAGRRVRWSPGVHA